LAEIACGDFGGHHFVGRRQKTWLLPATWSPKLTRGDFGGHHFVGRRQKAWLLPASSSPKNTRGDFGRHHLRRRRRKKSLSSAAQRTGVDDGTRTHDNRDHNPGLYQLSYVHRPSLIARLACPAGLEPATLGLEGRCSIRLSYGHDPKKRP
jgi:hypothetical protein